MEFDVFLAWRWRSQLFVGLAFLNFQKCHSERPPFTATFTLNGASRSDMLHHGKKQIPIGLWQNLFTSSAIRVETARKLR
jgi:hypothetical protein